MAVVVFFCFLFFVIFFSLLRLLLLFLLVAVVLPSIISLLLAAPISANSKLPVQLLQGQTALGILQRLLRPGGQENNGSHK